VNEKERGKAKNKLKLQIKPENFLNQISAIDAAHKQELASRQKLTEVKEGTGKPGHGTSTAG
jgi:hypothetical protein